MNAATGVAIAPVMLAANHDPGLVAAARAHGFQRLVLPARVVDGPQAPAWREALAGSATTVVAIDAVGELRPYLDGSLSDQVERRRAEVVARLRGVLRGMPPLGARWLIVGPGRLAEVYQKPAGARERYLESLRSLTEACPPGVGVLTEALPFRVLADAAEVAAVVGEVGSDRLGAALDTGHALLAGERPDQSAATLGSALRLVLLDDADLTAGRTRLDQHLPLGEGAMAPREAAALGGLDVVFALNVRARPGRDPWQTAAASLRWWSSSQSSGESGTQPAE